MSMSTWVYGIRNLDDDSTFQKMIDVKLACEKAEIGYPVAVEKYFDEYGPEADVETLTRSMEQVEIESACTELRYDMTEVVEVDITKIPDGITKLRFTNSW